MQQVAVAAVNLLTASAAGPLTRLQLLRDCGCWITAAAAAPLTPQKGWATAAAPRLRVLQQALPALELRDCGARSAP